MALKAEIEAIVSQLTPAASFFYGTEDEFNAAMDDFDFSNDKPVVFMYSRQQVGFAQTVSPAVNNTYSIFLAFLYKIEFDGVNSAQAEPYDNKTINLINQFLVRLKNYRGTNGGKVFKVDSGDKTKQKPIYFNYADVNLYGRSFGLDLNTFYNDKYCF